MIVNNGSNVGSIGSIGEPYFDSHNNRIKGFYPDVVSNIREINEYIERARQLRNSSGATRITLRFITPVGLLLPSYEAVIPLNDNWKDYQIIYYGENSRERMSPHRILRQEDELVSWVLANRRNDNPIERIKRLGYTVDILPDVTNDDIRQLLQVYSEAFLGYTFEINENNIRELTTNPTSKVTVARNYNNEIVSVIIGEISRIPTSRGDLTICEYSDEATLKAYRRFGLSQACLQALCQELYRNDVNLIYGEARACSIGANKVPVNLGFQYAGRLPKHCRIGGDKDIPEKGPFENLNVVYLPK